MNIHLSKLPVKITKLLSKIEKKSNSFEETTLKEIKKGSHILIEFSPLKDICVEKFSISKKLGRFERLLWCNYCLWNN